ncbi:MAG: hypothetical protein HYR66_03180 [Sphingobacteriales bacterium]|nr:hypothetical protein [Sphingobacteriales bacterium]MBI3717311.1 hypothetical protein [Sphingobacteriales bacterium]
MRDFILIILLYFIQLQAQSQTFEYPNSPKTGKSIRDFIPSNWFLKDSVSGDLNKDRLKDFVIIIESKDSIDEKRPDSSINYGSPRVLIILFEDKITNSLKLALQHNTFITRYGEGGMDPDVYGDMSISKNVLQINYQFVRGMANYKIRYQLNDFYLIGAYSTGVSGGQLDVWDVNLLTQKAKHEWGDISDDKLKTKWIKLPSLKPKKFADFTMMYTWKISNDIIL